MRLGLTLATAVSLLSISEALTLAKRDGPPAVVHLDTQRRAVKSHIGRDRLRRRANTLQVELDNLATLYYVNITLGTPGQALRLDIDTGSSDLWVNSDNSNLCQGRQQFCSSSGTYDANSSSSYSYVNSDFYIKYADGSQAAGDYVKDTLGIGKSQIEDMQFGIGYDSSSPQGILGVGYPANEVQVAYARGKSYPNLPMLLEQKEMIQAPAYSLWLNDLDANSGSILFGGVDTDKYHGDLQSVPVIKESGMYREFIVGLSSITAAGKTILDNNPIPVLLDSGSSLTYLPDDTAQAIFDAVGATYRSDAGAAIISCEEINSDKTVDFSFSGVKISVPMNELVLVEGYSRGQPLCVFGISNAGSSTSVLGDTFLRSAYVVYDLSSNEISLAATNFNATSSSIKEITGGDDGVPNAKDVPNAVSTLAVAYGGARQGGINPSVTVMGAAATPTAMAYGPMLAAGVGGLLFAL